MNHYGPLIRILHCCFSQAMNNGLADMDLTSAQGHIIGFLARQKEPPCPRDIEEEFHLTHPTVSGLLSRMEKKGFIELRPDPDDRRCKRVCILQKGRELDEIIWATIQGIECQIVRDFTETEKQQFADLLIRAAQNMGSESYTHKPKEETNQ